MYGIALAQALLFRMHAAMSVSFITPAFKALLSASAASHSCFGLFVVAVSWIPISTIYLICRPMNDACTSPSFACIVLDSFLAVSTLFYMTVAAVPWATPVLFRHAIDAVTPRVTEPLSALAAPTQEADSESGDGPGPVAGGRKQAQHVYEAYRSAVRQADALSSQFASLWVASVASTAAGVVSSVLSAWNAASSPSPAVSATSVGTFSAYSVVLCLDSGLLLQQAALVHTRASAALAQAAATEGDISLSDRGALYSMLQQRPIAFTVHEVAITEGLLLRVLAGLATGVLPPVLKVLVGV